MHLQGYLKSAAIILHDYKGEIPFAAWVKNFFKQHKKYGSRDRRFIADLSFCFFRLGRTFSSFSLEERLLTGQFLCHNVSPFIRELKPEWLHMTSSSVEEKMAFLNSDEKPHFFSLPDEISPEINKASFQFSFLQQPDLFIRIRPGKEKAVIEKLSEAGVSFEQEKNCLRLSNNTKVDEVIRLDEEAVVQDVSSQKVLEPLQRHLSATSFSAWDCCAASGGKTILLHDTYPKAKLTVSDIRESILINLKNRMKRAGISSYHSFVADISSSHFSIPQQFNVIMCDAPCSGSGTWGRTPEQLVFFGREKIDHYTALQKKIVMNASRSVKKGGFLLYITCSVFSRENEEVVDFVQQRTGLLAVTQQYFKGYDKRGDTLFAALFTA